jgi:flagellar L-ring protein precursor FlgH
MKTMPLKTLYVALSAFILIGSTSVRADDKKDDWKMAKKLYKDTKAKEVGDLITVLITEETLASKDAKSSSSKSTSAGGTASFAHPKIDNRETTWTNATLPAYSLEASRKFQGDGSIENSEKFTASITVRVIDVMPNGNLLIEGSRKLVLQKETMTVHIAGTVRPTDITRRNTINSSDIADASIKYASKGPLAKNQERGLVTRLSDWINPF